MVNKSKKISIIPTGSWVPSSFNNAKNNKDTYQVQINELTVNASIGIHEHEKKKKQRVSISLAIEALDNLNLVNEKIDNVVSYELIIKDLKKIINQGHIELLETLGEKILEICFKDQRILSVWMKLEKLDVFDDAKSVGIEIIRDRTDFVGKKNISSNVAKIKK